MDEKMKRMKMNYKLRIKKIPDDLKYYSKKYWYTLCYFGLYIPIFNLLKGSTIRNLRNTSQKGYLAYQHRDKEDRHLASVLLNNTIGGFDYVYDSDFSDKFLINLTGRIIKELLIFQNFIGIQPMTTPVGLNYFLRRTTTDTSEMCLSIQKHTVEAYSRKFSFKISMAMTQKLIDEEMLSILSTEIAHEIFNYEVLGKIEKYSEKEIIDLSECDFVNTRSNEASNALRKASNKIAMETRRGTGNVAIFSPELLSLLQWSGITEIKTESVDNLQMGKVVSYVGKINDYKVFVNPYMSGYEAYMMYKGINSVDAGLVISPYMINIPQIIVDERTTGFLYRGGFGENRTDLIAPENYYKKLTFKIE